MKTLYYYSKKYKIPHSTLYSRVRVQGLTIKQAVNCVDKRGATYLVYDGKVVITLFGASAVADYLSKRTRTNITKDVIIGRMYRAHSKIITIGKFIIKKEGDKC